VKFNAKLYMLLEAGLSGYCVPKTMSIGFTHSRVYTSCYAPLLALIMRVVVLVPAWSARCHQTVLG